MYFSPIEALHTRLYFIRSSTQDIKYCSNVEEELAGLDFIRAGVYLQSGTFLRDVQQGFDYVLFSHSALTLCPGSLVEEMYHCIMGYHMWSLQFLMS